MRHHESAIDDSPWISSTRPRAAPGVVGVHRWRAIAAS
jgi:hypothetical protein